MIGYIARDKDGKLYLYSEKPEYDDESELWFGGDYLSMSDGLLLCKEFEGLSYKDEPVKVRIEIEKI